MNARGRRRQPARVARVLEVAAAVVDVEREGLADDVGDEEVLVAVGVEVAGGDAHAAFGIAGGVHRRARQQPLVRERAVALVDPELVRRGVVGDVEVEPAVAVVVAGRDAEARAVGLADAGRLGDVGEPAVALVAVEPVGHRPIRARAAVVARADGVVADLLAASVKSR